MHVMIYGAGAVGLGLASFLLQAKAEVTLVAREDTVRLLRSEGLRRTGIFGEFRAAPADFYCLTRLNDLPRSDCRYILVCTKSQDTVQAAEEIAAWPWIRKFDGHIVLCQNGWGNAEPFAQRFPREQVASARVITGFRRPRENQVDITVHADAMHLGSLYGLDPKILEPLAQAIEQGGLPCKITRHIGKDLWAKMLYNCALNGLGAILGVPYGKLGDSEHTRRIMNGIVEEVFRVMKPSGYETHWERPEQYLAAFYENLLPATYEHESSMLQDLRARKRTEVDALNGIVVRQARALGIEVPFNEMVYRMVKYLEG